MFSQEADRSGIALMPIAIVVLVSGLRFYGKWLERKWGVNTNKPTPAHTIPTSMQAVFG